MNAISTSYKPKIASIPSPSLADGSHPVMNATSRIPVLGSSRQSPKRSSIPIGQHYRRLGTRSDNLYPREVVVKETFVRLSSEDTLIEKDIYGPGVDSEDGEHIQDEHLSKPTEIQDTPTYKNVSDTSSKSFTSSRTSAEQLDRIEFCFDEIDTPEADTDMHSVNPRTPPAVRGGLASCPFPTDTLCHRLPPTFETSPAPSAATIFEEMRETRKELAAARAEIAELGAQVTSMKAVVVATTSAKPATENRGGLALWMGLVLILVLGMALLVMVEGAEGPQCALFDPSTLISSSVDSVLMRH
ncbi:hypothetical protein HDU93_009682 [Gonapodya sp. JEL0774]|nr:hypothetical protein HDU93_009682 [Gonapodya sp. JEL0774]